MATQKAPVNLRNLERIVKRLNAEHKKKKENRFVSLVDDGFSVFLSKYENIGTDKYVHYIIPLFHWKQ